ncbi:MAG: GMP synthase [Gammaproteobacteria bacterium]|nr:GMP synthase [Gammaproteobacteria bacterium]
MIIGILEADPALEPLRDEFGSYVKMFKDLLNEGAEGRKLDFRVYNVLHGQYPADLHECDGYLITGSRASVYDDEEWIRTLRHFVVKLHDAKKKLIGICFGHQLVAQALGGKTEAAEVGWGVGVHTSRVLEATDYMLPGEQEISLLVSHKDQVTELPDGAKLLASSDFCTHAMFQVDNHILTFQGHPEFVKGYSRGLMELRQEILGPDKYLEGIASLQKVTNEKSVARWLLAFMDS